VRDDESQDTRLDVSPEIGPKVNGAVLQRDQNGLSRSRSRLERAEKLLVIGLIIFVFLLWYVGTKKWSKIWPPGSSHDPQSLAGDLEATPEVRNATRGEWIEGYGWWSKFGVLGTAFDGEGIVINSAEGENGSLGCWISPQSYPLGGVCHESSGPSHSKLRGEQLCSWRLVVDEISPDRIHGSRVLKREGSDAACLANYGLLPSFFTWERPRGQRAR
jgi:hypothetical protein